MDKARSTQPRILLVEDEIIIARDLEHRLRRLGYDVCGIATSGETAIALAEQYHPELVVMDVRLASAMDGVETANRLHIDSKVPVIFVTGQDDPEFLERMKGSKPFAYVLKPCSDPEIQAAVEIALVRSKIEQDLMAQKHWLSAVLNAVNDAVIAVDPGDRVTFLNLRAETLTGWSNDEARGKEASEICRWEDHSRLIRRDGTERHVEMRSHVLRDSEGTTFGKVLALADVTERVAAETANCALDMEYRILMEEASDAITMSDPEGWYVAVNSRACEMLGYSRDEFLRLNIRDLLPPEELKRDPIHFNELKAGKTLVRERKLLRKDGSIIDVELSAKAMTNGRLQAILRDISERKRVDAEFKEAVRSEVLDRLLTKLRAFSHGQSSAVNLNRLALFAENIDLLKAMTSAPDQSPQQRFIAASDEFQHIVSPQLRLLSSLLSIVEEDPGFADITASFDESARTLGRAAQSLQEILTLLNQRVKSGLPLPEDEELKCLATAVHQNIHDIHTCVSAAAEALRSRYTCLPASVIALVIQKFQIEPSSPSIRFTGSHVTTPAIIGAPELAEALSILLQNSCEALNGTSGNTDHQIAVHLSDHIERLRIEVEDTGLGIPAGSVSRLFDPDFSTKGSGRGFGLPYARSCVAKYGGSIHCDPYVDRGARFVLELLKA